MGGSLALRRTFTDETSPQPDPSGGQRSCSEFFGYREIIAVDFISLFQEPHLNLTRMKYYQCPVAQAMGIKPYSQDCDILSSCKRSSAPKSVRSVHFPNDIVFQDYVRHGELERIGRFIRARRVSLDTIYLSGMAAIHEAVLSGNLECVKLLVHHGADIHQRDEEGWTPLHMACSDGFPHIARYLLSLGADPELENDCAEKPADLIEPDNKELLELFGLLAVND